MPIAGGVYVRSDGTRTGSTVNVAAEAAGAKCTSALADKRENDLATAINACLFRDGSNAATDDLDLGSNKITAVADGVAETDAATKGQMDTAIAAMFSAFGASLTLAADDAAARAIMPPFESGTVQAFYQATAPTGWTKITTYNNAASRIVSGTPSSGGSVDFTTAFSSKTPTGTVAGHTLTSAEMPIHTHGVTDPGHAHSYNAITSGQLLTSSTSLTYSSASSNTGTAVTGISIQNAGSGGPHSHFWTGDSINLAVKYVDCILCSMDAAA